MSTGYIRKVVIMLKIDSDIIEPANIDFSESKKGSQYSMPEAPVATNGYIFQDKEATD